MIKKSEIKIKKRKQWSFLLSPSVGPYYGAPKAAIYINVRIISQAENQTPQEFKESSVRSIHCAKLKQSKSHAKTWINNAWLYKGQIRYFIIHQLSQLENLSQ